MTESRKDKPFYAHKYYRLITGVFGLLLAVAGVYVLLSGGPLDALRLLGAAAFLLAGGNQSYAALTARESWLSKVGPLP